MKKVLILVCMISLFATGIWANGLSLNSIGPRSLGMGGAMVGLANDPTAIYWNPAGLAGQQNQILAFATDIIPMATYKLDALSIDAESEKNHNITPNIFAVYGLQENITLGFGMYFPAGLGVEWKGSELTPLSGGQDLKWKSQIAAIDFAPSIAYQVNEKMSLGLAANIYYGMFDLDKPITTTDTSGTTIAAQYTESSDGTGIGASFGGLYKFNDRFQFGFSARTQAKLKMSGDCTNPLMAASGDTKSKFDRDVSLPMWLAGGIAFKPFHIIDLTITADAQYSQWSESEDEFIQEFKNELWVDYGFPQNVMKLEWEDCTQIRLGAEYKPCDPFAYRLGYYYDPAPAPDETLNILFPSMTNNVVTAGFGYKTLKWNLDLGLEYLIGKERDITTATAENMPGEHQMNIFAFGAAFGYNF